MTVRHCLFSPHGVTPSAALIFLSVCARRPILFLCNERKKLPLYIMKGRHFCASFFYVASKLSRFELALRHVSVRDLSCHKVTPYILITLLVRERRKCLPPCRVLSLPPPHSRTPLAFSFSLKKQWLALLGGWAEALSLCTFRAHEKKLSLLYRPLSFTIILSLYPQPIEALVVGFLLMRGGKLS